MAQRRRSLAGIKPTGNPHLGNYLGFLKPALALQDSRDMFYFIADYHALTTVQDPQELKEQTFDLVATFAALGILAGLQLVRRLRRVLFKAGIQNVIESGYGSGYRLRLRTM